MTVVVLSGLGAAIGVLGLVRGLRRPRPSLQALLQRLEDDAPVSARMAATRPGNLRLDLAFGTRLDEYLGQQTSLKRRLDPELRLTGNSLLRLCSQACVAASVGLILPIVWWAIVTAGDLHVSIVIPIGAAVVCAIAGAILPFGLLFTDAKRRRREARRAVGAYLDLVVLCLAGGMGIEGALHAASRVGDDDISNRLLEALLLARDAGKTPWDALAAVGDELGVSQLSELAAATGLAGNQGARIRSTLAAKAASIRRHELADAEAEANAVTERLFLPGVLLLLGFLIFIGYPAVARIASGL